jgi:hypothetical protein
MEKLNTISQLSDKELLEELKKIKPSPLLDTFIIGFLVGIIIFSVAVSSWGFLTLIPLTMIYVFLKKSKRYDAIKNEIKERKLEIE